MDLHKRIVWSYCIYGFDHEKYYKPMVVNMEMAKRSGATIVVHTTEKSEKYVRNFFTESDSLIVLVHSGLAEERWAKSLRFLSPKYIEAEYYFYKDSDSIVTADEIAIGHDWMDRKGQSEVIIIRDHPLHIAPILAGMFGANKKVGKEISEEAEKYFFKGGLDVANHYSYDQDWLARFIYPKVRSSALVYSSFFYYRGEKLVRTPARLDNYEYIGAQAYCRASGEAEIIPYLWMYRNELLSLPYVRRLHFLYGRVRPSLFLAYLLSRLCTRSLHR